MAFVVGNRARVKLSKSGTLASGSLCPQPPLLGVVIAIAGGGGDADNITVLMGDGRELVVHGAFLVLVGDTTVLLRNALIDKIVTGWITPPSPPVAGVPYMSPYTGRVVDVYTVDAAIKVLVAALENGMFYELPIANVKILGDR
jgi:hypothetical protein